MPAQFLSQTHATKTNDQRCSHDADTGSHATTEAGTYDRKTTRRMSYKIERSAVSRSSGGNGNPRQDTAAEEHALSEFRALKRNCHSAGQQ